VKRHELLDHLRRNGCELEREGTRHSIFTNRASGAKAPVPRHSEIDNRLAMKICQQLAIPPIHR
jgi:mRNA interferase HicA